MTSSPPNPDPLTTLLNALPDAIAQSVRAMIQEIMAPRRGQGAGEVPGHPAAATRPTQRDAIIKALQEAGEPLSPIVITKITEGKRVRTRQLLGRMVRSGKVVKVAHGRYLPARPEADAHNSR